MENKEISEEEKAVNKLYETVKYTGFNIEKEELKQFMFSPGQKFEREIAIKEGDSNITYTLNFNNSQTSKNTFLNSFRAVLDKSGVFIANTFYADQKITRKDAYNMLEGRSVEKKYNNNTKTIENGKVVYKPNLASTYLAWRKLDFTDKDENGNFKMLKYGEARGFKLEESVDKLPIKFASDDHRFEFYKDMRKGELKKVDFEKHGQTLGGFVSANPTGRTMNVYNNEMSRIPDINQHLKNLAVQSEKETQGKNLAPSENLANDNKVTDLKKSVKEADDVEPPKQSAVKKKGRKVS